MSKPKDCSGIAQIRRLPRNSLSAPYCNPAGTALCLRIDFGQTRGRIAQALPGARQNSLPNIDEPGHWTRLLVGCGSYELRLEKEALWKAALLNSTTNKRV